MILESRRIRLLIQRMCGRLANPRAKITTDKSSLRVTLAFACTLFLASSCVNEPFTLLPLAITSVENTSTNTTSHYTYKDRRIRTYIKFNQTDTLSMMNLYYTGDQLDSIVIDSTRTSYGVMRIAGSPGMPAQDSLYQVTAGARTLQQVRKFNYNDGQHISSIDVDVFQPAGITHTVYTLTWTGENITTLKREITDPAGATSETTLSIGHDSHSGIYSGDVAYLYTIALDDFYWLSANNPVRFKRDALAEYVYTYYYNTMNYPSHIRTDKNQTIGHTYVELR
jgi:hypothetical protein